MNTNNTNNKSTGETAMPSANLLLSDGLTVNSEHCATFSKEEAIEALVQGKKLTHTLFSENEWIRQPDPSVNKYECEDGVVCMASMFWHFREQPYWLKGWSVWSE